MARVKRIFKAIWNYIRTTDIILWLIILAISAFSIVLLQSVSRATTVDYARTQMIASALGIAGAIIISIMDYELVAEKWKIIAVISVLLMIYTKLFGENIQNSGEVDATSWILIGGRTFQTSELIKIAFIITFSKHLDMLVKSDKLNSASGALTLTAHLGVIFLLCSWQGDTGAGIVFVAMALFMAFIAGLRIRFFAVLFAGAALLVPLAWQFWFKPYQKLRFSAIFNLDDPEVQINEGYQQYQGMISIGSGEVNGTGLGNGPRVASNSVTFQQSDFIFSVAGEELGFIGCVAIIALLAILMLKVLHVAHSSRDNLGRYMCYGFFGLIFIQTVVNIGMCLTILPVMGLTLPFFSAGGSSAMCLYFGIGLVQSVYSRRKENGGFHLSRKAPLKLQYNKLRKRA